LTSSRADSFSVSARRVGCRASSPRDLGLDHWQLIYVTPNGNAKRFTPSSRRQIWLQNQGIRALPYMPGKNWVLSLATRGVKEAANAITLPSPAPY
jgi:hypothetical protein